MEPLNPIVLHFASGASLFSGAFLLLLLLALARRLQRRWWRTLRDMGALSGALMIALSATPLPLEMIWWTPVLTLAWIVCERIRRDQAAKVAMFFRGGLATLVMLMAVFEFPHRFMPALPEGVHDRVYVLGDSISQGIVKGVSWPQSLAARHQVTTINLARNGAFAVDARKQAADIPPDATLVIVEIGGNDMLGGTSADQFAFDLDRLLDVVRSPGRTVVMLELPLPPTFEQWGVVQRGLSKKYSVVLVPKSYFARALGTPDGTADGLHLSAQGADAMADIIFEALKPILRPAEPEKAK